MRLDQIGRNMPSVGNWVAIIAVLLLLGGLAVLGSRLWFRRGANGRQPWNRQDGLAAASLISGVVLGILSLVLPLTADGQSSQAPTRRSAKLEVVSMELLDHDSENPGPGVDIRVTNTGTAVSVLTAVSFSVEMAGRLEICEPGGALTSSYEYQTELPLDAKEGDEFTVPISQELRPNRADRFTIRLGLEPHNPEEGGYVVYVMRIELKHSMSAKETPLGRALVILPLNTAGAAEEDYSNYLLLEDPSADGFPCYQANRELLRSAAAVDEIVVSPKFAATALY